MKFTTFAAILTVALTANVNVSTSVKIKVNVSAFDTPINAETIKENRIEITENNNKSEDSQEGSQGNKCFAPFCK